MELKETLQNLLKKEKKTTEQNKGYAINGLGRQKLTPEQKKQLFDDFSQMTDSLAKGLAIEGLSHQPLSPEELKTLYDTTVKLQDEEAKSYAIRGLSSLPNLTLEEKKKLFSMAKAITKKDTETPKAYNMRKCRAFTGF